MSRGISWRQRSLLHSAWRKEQKRSKYRKDDPIAWRELDYGPTSGKHDYFSPQGQWNIEQATRRALRNLEQRGFVELATYSFFGDGHEGWYCHYDLNDHIRGRDRYMTGVSLTDKGREIALEEEREIQRRRGEPQDPKLAEIAERARRALEKL
jgi:hypothetical protein